MKQIYKAPLRKLTVKNLEINDGVIKKIDYDSPIIRKDLLFYKNRMGAFISFEHETRLPDIEEAKDYVQNALGQSTGSNNKYPSCPYVNEEEFEYSHEISKESFKAVKKYYKSLRKKEK